MIPALLALMTVAQSDALPLLVGGHAHGATNIQVLRELGLGNFVWIPKLKYSMGNTPWDVDPAGPHGIYADVDACVAAGLYFAVSQRRGLGEIWRPGGFEYGGDCWGGDLHPAEVVREIRRRAGALLVGLHAEELDCDFLQNGIRAGYRSRVPHLYDFTDRAGGRAAFEGELARIGADLVMAELLESLPTTELQLAYLRGGARQFGRPWGVWVSPWHGGKVPCEDKGLWPAGPAEVGGGHPASAFRRCLYLAYVSGARVLTVQETEPLFSRADLAAPARGYALAAWGRELKSFWEYVKQHPEPVRPLAGLAVLVDRDNGWTPGNLHGGWIERDVIWAKLRPERGDAMLAAYLDVLIPGFRRTEPDCWAQGKLYPGYFAATPAGPFDIVASDIDAERLAAYPAVILLGDMAMTDELLAVLRAYVAGGGVLFVNVHQMRRNEAFVQDEQLLGATIGGAIIESDWAGGPLIGRRIYSSQRIHVRTPLPGVERETYDEHAYALQDVQPATAEVVADDGAGNPVLLRHAYGKGWAYLSTAEYMLEGWGDQYRPLRFFVDLLRGLAHQQPVAVTQPDSAAPVDDLSWLTARRGERTLVLLVNHGAHERVAQVVLAEGARLALEAGGGGLIETRRTAGAGRALIAVPPDDVALVSFASH